LTAIRDAITIVCMHQLELWTHAPAASAAASVRQVRVATAQLQRGMSRPPSAAPVQLDPRLVPELPYDPELLRLQEAVGEFVRQARADATRKAYTGDWKAFTAWCEAHGELALPASPATLAMYLAQLAQVGRKYSSIRRARTAIGQVHAAASLDRPDRDPRIRVLERGIGRSIGTREQGAAPLCAAELARAVDTLQSSMRDVRDRALLLLGFAGGYRSSDLVTLDVEHVRFIDADAHIFLPRSKEDQLARGRTTVIRAGAKVKLCPVRALQHWLELAGHRTGPLFRVINGARLRRERIHPRAVTRAVQRATKRAGIAAGYSSHSLRAGLTTSADAQGHSLRAIQEHVGWLDTRSPARYIDPRRNTAHNVVSGLL
jgi:integrase